jgi:hypothetical protein
MKLDITKVKVRKYLHLAGILVAGAAASAIWLAHLGIDLPTKVSATLVLATTLLTSLKSALAKADELVEILPIPEGTTSTTTTTTTTTEKSDPPRPVSGGYFSVGGALWLLALTIVLALLAQGYARAEAPSSSPPAGGCFTPRLCVGPSASLSVASFNLATSNFAGGASPGIGYGATFTPSTAPWAAVGLDIYASTKIGQGVPNQASFSLMLHWMNVYVGIGPSVIQGSSGKPVTVQWSVLAGPGVSIQSAQSSYRASAAQ